MKPTFTMWTVLRVLVERGGADYWTTLAAEVRSRSGRTVRPNRATLEALVKKGFVDFGSGQYVSITMAGANYEEMHRAAGRASSGGPNG